MIQKRMIAAACGFAFALTISNGCSTKDAPVTVAAIERTTQKGPVELTVAFQPETPAVGDTALLTITAKYAEGVQLSMPVLEAEKDVGGFEVSSAATPPDIPAGDAQRTITHLYSLRTFESGEHEIPSFSIKFQAPGLTEESEIVSPPFFVTVRTTLQGEVDPTQYRDIKEAVAIRTPWSAAMWRNLIIALVLMAFIIAVIVWFIRRRAVNLNQAPPLPPHVWAMQQLDALTQEKLLERAAFHEFFFRLSSIVRQYIERRFDIMAAEQTTEEFLRESRRSPQLNEGHRALLTDFLRQADMVKFARFQPTHHEGDAAFAAAKRFINETIPRGDSRADNSSTPAHQVQRQPQEVGT